jgi:hypothetical protein
MTITLAFNNNAVTKKRCLECFQSHIDSRTILATSTLTWDGVRGSASACLIDSAAPEDFERELGMPRAMTGVIDLIYTTGTSTPTSVFNDNEKVRDYVENIQVGIDTTSISGRFVSWLFKDTTHGICKKITDERVKSVVRRIVQAHGRDYAAGDMTQKEWAALRKETTKLSDELADRDRFDPDHVAIVMAETSAWPIAKSVTVARDVLAKHLSLGIEHHQQLVMKDAGWSEDDQATLQQFRDMVETGDRSANADLRKSEPYSSMFKKIEAAQKAYSERQSTISAPYWNTLKKISASL